MNQSQWFAAAQLGEVRSCPIDLRIPHVRAQYAIEFKERWCESILKAIQMEGSSTCNDVARAMHVARSLIRAYINHLHAKGLITFDMKLRKGRWCRFWRAKK